MMDIAVAVDETRLPATVVSALVGFVPRAGWRDVASFDDLLESLAGVSVLIWAPEETGDALTARLVGLRLKWPALNLVLLADHFDPESGRHWLSLGIHDCISHAEIFRLASVLGRLGWHEHRHHRVPDFAALLDHMPALISYWDTRLCNCYANQAYREWYLVDPDWLYGRSIRSFLPETLLDRIKPHLDGVLSGHYQCFECEIPRPDGQGMRQAQVHYIPDWQGGRLAGFFVMASDISVLKGTEQALRRSQQRLKGVFDILPVGVAMTDAEGRIVDGNTAALRLLGLDRDTLLGRTLHSPEWTFRRIDGQEVPRDEYVSVRALRERRPVQDVEVMYVTDTARRWFSVSAMPMDDPDTGVITAFIDITELRQLAEAQREMRHQYESMVRDQVAFQALAGMAHSLNQPLAAIAFYLEAAHRMAEAEPPNLDKLRDILRKSAREIERAGEVLHQQISRCYRPRYVLETVNLDELLSGVVKKYRLWSDAGFAVELKSCREIMAVRVNVPRTEMILENLLRNSGEAMSVAGVDPRQGRIELSCHPEGSFVRLSVRDEGPGVPEDLAKQIFEPFFTTRESGNGMGLAIGRTLAEAQGGQLWLTPTPSGALFNLTLPIAP
ncbi:MAG: PAS domain-containing protein [Pseudomonadota bacterium]